MKSFILAIGLYLGRTAMQIIYFFIKLFTRQKNKVTMLSRQSNNINLDFRLIKEELEKSKDINLDIKILCKKIPKNYFGRFKYCFYIIKCMYHIATSKACIIDGYNIPISALKHKKNTEIIQIWHAMGAIKKFGYQCLNKSEGTSSKVAEIMKMHENYTCVTCTSKATRKIYAEAFKTDIEKVKVLGMPRIDYILGKNNEINNKIEELENDYPYLKKKKTILYVPTFRKDETLDLDELINIIDKEKYNLIIKLHPLDKTKVDKEYKVSNKYNTFDLLKFADYIITDYSAIAFETAILNKPLFFYIYDINNYEDKRGINIDLQKEMRHSTNQEIGEIIKIIDNNSYNYGELTRFREKYIETIDTNNSKRITDYIIQKIKKVEKL